MTKNIFRLSDERILGYAQFGPLAGVPVLYFHGTPSSRLEVLLLKEYGVDLEELLQQRGLRLMVVDRPGSGISDFNPTGNFDSFAHDVKQLLQHLNIHNCYLLCWSGGGPFALTMGYLYPTIIKGIFILCGFTRPLDGAVLREMNSAKWYFRAARYFPLLAKIALGYACRHNNGLVIPRRLAGLPAVDYNLLKDRSHFGAFSSFTLKQACCQGTGGPVYEAGLYFRTLGFELSDIIQPVHYWWGTEDKNVVQLHARSAEKDIRECTLHYKKGEGHLSLYIRYFGEALDAIAAAGPAE